MQNWDEHRWEAFISEAERRSRETRRYLDTHLGELAADWEELFDRDPEDSLNDYVELSLLNDVAYFPDDDDDWDEDDEEDEGVFLSDACGWLGSLDDWNVFREARELAIWACSAVPQGHNLRRDPRYHAVVEGTFVMVAKLNIAFGFSVDTDYLGGHLVFCRRSLDGANRALAALQQLRDEPGFDVFPYAVFHARLFETRNDIAEHIQNARERGATPR